MYSYQKATKKNPHPGRKIPLYLKTIPTLISALGLSILGAVVYPVVSYQAKDFKLFSFADKGLLSPAYYQSQAEENQDPVVISGLDFTKASSWFPGSVQNELLLLQTIHLPPNLPRRLPDLYPHLHYGCQCCPKDEDQ